MSKKNISKFIKENALTYEGIPLLEGEYFIDLKTDLYPMIDDIYAISNKGRIYSKKLKRLIKIRVNGKNHNGYCMCKLHCKQGYSKSYMDFGIHRLLMVMFKPVPNMKNLVVNHIDGNKTNNDLDNLEWTTFQGNTIHAYKTGLAKGKKGEDASNVSITEETAIKICDLYMTGEYTKQQIADMCNTSKSVVVNITTYNSWDYITEKYDFSKRPTFRKSKDFNVDEIHNICKYFVNHKKTNNVLVRNLCIDAIMDVKKIKKDKITKNMFNTVYDMFYRRRYKRIVDLYTY